ncbi:IS21 family transposase, partial [Plantactinospora solaniradicis]
VCLPPVPPVTGWRLSTRLPRDHYVRVDANDYSVDPAVVGRRVDITADADQVNVSCDGRPVASHDRCWAAGQTITDPVHRDAAARLRQAHRLASVRPVVTEVQHRTLTDYDRVFGIEIEEVMA